MKATTPHIPAPTRVTAIRRLIFPTAVLCSALVAGACLRRAHYSIEALQALLFLPVCLGFVLFVSREFRRVATIVIAPTVIFGIVMTLIGWGYFPAPYTVKVLSLSRLRDDPQQKFGFQFERSYDVVRRTYDLPRMSVNFFDLSAKDALARQASRQGKSPLFITGSTDWFDISVPPFGTSARSRSGSETDADMLSLYRSHVVTRRISIDGPELKIVALPARFTLPAEPQILAQHFLGWLARALEASGITSCPTECSYLPARSASALDGELMDAFTEAAQLNGPWRSPLAMGMASLLRGSALLVHAVDDDVLDEGELNEADRDFIRASRRIRKQDSPDNYAILKNNEAVLRILRADSAEDSAKAIRALWQAATVPVTDFHESFGQRAAMENLLALTAAGMNDLNGAPRD